MSLDVYLVVKGANRPRTGSGIFVRDSGQTVQISREEDMSKPLSTETKLPWFLRRSGQWWEFDPEPRRSYYKFLRAVYGMEASVALKRCERWSPESRHVLGVFP